MNNLLYTHPVVQQIQQISNPIRYEIQQQYSNPPYALKRDTYLADLYEKYKSPYFHGGLSTQDNSTMNTL